MEFVERGRIRGGAGLRAAARLAPLLALLAAGPGLAAKGGATVRGTVKSLEGDPLAGIQVTLEAADGSSASDTTDKRGKFSIEVAAGEHTVRFEGEGYAPFETPLTVEDGDRPVITIELLDAAAGRRSAAAKAFNAGAAKYEAGDREAAKADFLAALEADPTLLEGHRVLADLYLEEGAWSEAAAAAETVLAEQPEDPHARLVAYEAYRKLENRQRVVELREALAGDPELAPKLAVHAFNEGALADQAGDAETAAARFSEALELDGSLAAAHFAKATVELRGEQYAAALATLESGLALEPASVQGRRLAFLAHDALGDGAAAAAAIEAWAEVDAAGAAKLLFERAETDFRNDRRSAARETLERLVALQPEHAAGHRLLGLVHLTGNAGLARRHLRRFLELAPDDPEAAAVREILANLG